MKKSLYIHGSYVGSNSDESFETINPATGQSIERIGQASLKDVEEAIESAEKDLLYGLL